MLGGTWVICVLLQALIANDFYFDFIPSLLLFLFIFFFFLGDVFGNSIGEKKTAQKVEDLRGYQSIGFKRKFTRILIFLGCLSLLGSILYFGYFVRFFGSIYGALTAGWAVRGAMQEISVPIYVRAILMLGYSCVIIAIDYYILYRKIRWFLLLPFISLFLMGIAQAGRAGFMMVIFELFISVFWLGVFDVKNKPNAKKKIIELQLLKNSLKLIVIILVIFVGGDMLRRQDFSLNANNIIGATNVFKSYLFGGISAFTTYFRTEYSEITKLGYGRFSFTSLFDLLGLGKSEFGIYTNYLRISQKDSSMTTNIFTAFRQYIDDFGIIGTIIFMFVVGIFSGVHYSKAVTGNLKSISIMIVLYTYLFHTILLSITVHNGILISVILPSMIINFCKK